MVEDDDADAFTIKRTLKSHMRHPCNIRHAAWMSDAETTLRESTDLDLILLDLSLPDTHGAKETFKRLENIKDKIPVIILTGSNDRDLAIEIMRNGAEDFIFKSTIGTDPDALCEAIDFAVCRHKNFRNIKERKHQELINKDKMIEWISGSALEQDKETDKNDDTRKH
ncbi:MAG: response regulator [Alphaproteobacteria bacterium]|nr:response regulator [Alphaproteobacteria bacterium]